MLESLVFPKEGVKKPWKLFLVGLLYSTLSFLIVHFVFSRDVVLSRYSGLLMVMFSVLFSILFIYYSIKLEEEENIKDKNEEKALVDSWKILFMFLWLFVGFIIGFALWQVLLPSVVNFNAQIETYCVINRPTQYQACLDKYQIQETIDTLGKFSKGDFLSVFVNNILVLLFVLAFSLIFGAGAIFLIIWNASIIATVISSSIKYKLKALPLGLLRFMIHGLPEIAAYLAAAMAGGMTSLALSGLIRKKISKNNFWKIVQRSLYLVIIAIIILVIAGIIEVFVTPLI